MRSSLDMRACVICGTWDHDRNSPDSFCELGLAQHLRPDRAPFDNPDDL